MRRKHKKLSTTLNYIHLFLTVASTITGFISISAFASLLGVLIGITSLAKGLEICAIAARIKKYKSTKSILVKTMLSYYFKCRQNTGNKNPNVVKAKNGRIMLSSKCRVCHSKKSNFIKVQETSGLLSS